MYDKNFGTLIKSIHFGHLVIPENMTELPNSILDAHEGEKELLVDQITSVEIPGTVRRIGYRAFCGCVNLKQVTLAEGVESIADWAFMGCENLKTISLPASIRQIGSRVFDGTGLTEPVFSNDGKALVYYPQTSKASEYAVPEGVEEILTTAFDHLKSLKHVALPRSLKRIRSEAFLCCDLTGITIPSGVRIDNMAVTINQNKELHLDFEDPLSPLEYKMEFRRITGTPLLTRKWIDLPEDEYWKTAPFQALAKRCADGSIAAMDEMGDYFSARAKKARKDPEKEFYSCAYHFWRTRAYLRGSEKGRRFLQRWFKVHSNESLMSPYITEDLGGHADGKSLNALGFLFFDDDELIYYRLNGVDEQGVVMVCSSKRDPYDRDETYDDWWYLDDCLNLPYDIGSVNSYKNRYIQDVDELRSWLHKRVAAKIRERND